MFQLRTPRLLLRNLGQEDTALIRRMAQEPAVIRYQHLLRLNTEAGIDQWVQSAIFHNHQRPRHAYNLALVARHTGHPIGWIGWGMPRTRHMANTVSAMPCCRPIGDEAI